MFLGYRSIVYSNIYTHISNKTQRYTIYLYLEIALHVSGGTSTHHKEHTQLYLQHLIFVKPLLLPAAIAAVPAVHPEYKSEELPLRPRCWIT